ncbi:cysteine--tRNA ligase [Ancylobacter sp. 6x-1]|uniref:Cysteine--tRNA ligase n=1 Tax=Ancylobacter crimeensis TaxID=2579147 RepID=A0ABT0D879_9HYPH|nr:cysteine--tRNA ligase [Ancylobacter crimeensis]MCK0196158.1 cysteine--tRNA ligase [Ancylobacter crimeensis]
MPGDVRAGLPELKLYNTLTRTKESFAPIDPASVRMYVCGPTVYDFAHIGNARPVIVFDLLYRLLRHLYGVDHVRYVRNITDVDDKINARAAAEHPGLPLNEAIARVTFATEAQFHDDLEALGVLHPDVEPRATEHIAEMRTLIEKLVASGHAYVAEDHVLFSVPSMPDYGALSRRPLDEMIAGARVDVAPYKRDAMDFVLWKPSKEGEPGWPSPAGIAPLGRPGWHIECSAMSWRHLGETFDIHGGGIDLIFPHHENEIAQSRCAFHSGVMAHTWMHNGFLQVEGEKMSKSLGNFITIRQLLADWPGDVLRLNMLRTHYRQPIDWTLKGLEESAKALEQFFDAAAPDAYPRPAPAVLEALADDLNTPKAIAELHALKDHAGKKALGGTLAFLGFTDGPLRAWQAAKAPALDVDLTMVEARIAERIEARRNRDWAASDRIRDELLALGVALKDNKDGTTTWEPKR